MTIEEFLEARIAEAVKRIRQIESDPLALVMYDNMASHIRTAIEWHKNWPVMVEGELKKNILTGVDNLDEIRYRMTRQLDWYTREEFAKRFGVGAPTAPLLRLWAQQYAWHEDFQEEWLIK